ncbi:hypothetical protein L9F63_013097, partial [Diploptera punctata]
NNLLKSIHQRLIPHPFSYNDRYQTRYMPSKRTPFHYPSNKYHSLSLPPSRTHTLSLFIGFALNPIGNNF